MKKNTNGKLRVRLESFNHELLSASCQKITENLSTRAFNSIGMVTLPTSKRIYCVLRSPHVDKDSREHFEVRIHKRMLEVYYDLEMNIDDMLAELDLAPGVFYHISFS